MLRMAQIKYIKDLYENEEASLREICRITGHSFETVRKYAYQENWSEDNLPDIEPQSYPVLQDFIPIIDKWLEEDRKAPRKQRHNSSTVILDNFNSDIYSNGNMAIFGMTGAGKTYTILLMAMRFRMNGTQVFVIAPEKGFEYRGPCEALGGQYIKLARGSTDCINIMDIRRTTLDIDDNLAGHDSRRDSVMLDVVQDIKTYFGLRYPAMTPEERYRLNSALIECYGRFGITKDNNSLLRPDGSFKEMPTLADLYPIVNAVPELKNIAVIVKDLVESGMGGKTNVDLRSSFIVMDTSSAREEDLAATTFLATVFIRDEMSRSRTRKKAVFGDELWIIAGKEGNEQASEFVIPQK